MKLAAIYIPAETFPYIFGEGHIGQTINFGGQYIYKFDEDSNYNIKLIERKENLKFIENFWLNNVELVSAIVGENGTGKTTILNSFREVHSLCKFIYETSESEDFIFLNTPEINEIIYYSSFLNITQSDSENGNFKDLSKYKLMIDDTQNENLDLTTLLELHNSENLKRWIKFIEFNNQNDLLKKISLPVFDKIAVKLNYINIDPYQTSYRFRPFFEALKEKINKERENREQKIIDEIGLDKFQEAKAGNKIRLELEVITRVISKTQNILESSGNKYLEEGFIVDGKTTNDVGFKNANSKKAFFWFLKNSFIQLSKAKEGKKILFPFTQIKKLVETMLSCLPEDEEIENWTEFNVNFNQALSIIEAYENFLLAFKDDFSYDKKVLLSFSPLKNLSSGEKGLYDLFSVLHDHNYKFENDIHRDFNFFGKSQRIKNNFLIILDEADLGFHPEWKKKYVDIIQKVIPSIFKDNNIQIIISTHDPLTLSDLPNNNIVYLKKDKGITKILEMGDKQRPKKTFGANITNLLEDSFFVNDGLIGDFAKHKIEKTINWINDAKESQNRNKELFSKELKYHKDIISIIDEHVVKIKLAEMISELEDNKHFQREILNEEINFLTQKRDNLK